MTGDAARIADETLAVTAQEFAANLRGQLDRAKQD
jgi:hypothetical protein